MTQEELDALMAGDLDLENDDAPEIEAKDEVSDTEVSKTEEEPEVEAPTPPPATRDHQVVNQLDDVTKDSEVKAGEIFDALDGVMSDLDDISNLLEKMRSISNGFEELFSKLHDKFPQIDRFGDAMEENQTMLSLISQIDEKVAAGNDQILGAMDTMQYQDIHRQKIERVINIMRALSKYMSALFEGQTEDEKRVGSATHIEGDTDTKEVISNDDIEALIDQLGK